MKLGITGASGVLGTILVEKVKVKQYEYDCFDGDITNLENIYKK